MLFSRLLEAHPYELIWSKLLDAHIEQKVERNVTYTYVDYDALVRSQNFRLLLRVIDRMDGSSLSNDAYLAYLINSYNIKKIAALFYLQAVDSAYFNNIKLKLHGLDYRALFCLSENDLYFPNLNAFKGSDINQQLDTYIKVHGKKFFRYDRSASILYTDLWFDRQSFSKKEKESFISKIFPSFNFSSISIYFSDFGSKSNALKK